MTVMRCFVAIRPAEALRQKVAAIQEDLRRTNADVRWIGPEELHLTLRFFGDLEEADVRRLGKSLASLASSQPPFGISYEGLGEFPRVVWIGGSHEADPLAARIESVAGLPPEDHGFTAHLTIGRIRSRRGGKDLSGAISRQKDLQVGEDRVREFLLIRSTLRPQGPVYDVLESYALLGP